MTTEPTNPDPKAPSGAQLTFGDFASALVGFTDDVLFGQVWRRTELSPKERSLVTVAALTTSGNVEQLNYHLRFAVENGNTEAELIEAITHTIANDKQVILFQNRRGYSPYQVCQSCGWIPHCKQCDVSLTFHKLHNKLVCHYCGTVYPPVVTCEACGNHDFVQQNFGTERIEESLVEAFPQAKVARMDIDSVKGKHAHDALIQLFEQQRIDILVGTQMVVKGLDFDHVALVGVLDADAILGFADFRVNERAFQLMEQVSGRAGRKGAQGLVLIQTRNPKHPVLQWVSDHNYTALAEAELINRQQFSYPPFTRLIQLRFKHKLPDVVQAAARQFADWLKPDFGPWLVGPAAPLVNRVRNQYLMELLIKLPKEANMVQKCKEQIQLLTAHLHQQPPFKSVIITPDIDPM